MIGYSDILPSGRKGRMAFINKLLWGGAPVDSQ